MKIAKVTGTITAPIKNAHFENKKILVTQPLDLEGKKNGPALVAVDKARAGVGDIVLVMKEGGSARIIFDDEEIPLQAVVVGVIDGVSIADVGHLPIETW